MRKLAVFAAVCIALAAAALAPAAHGDYGPGSVYQIEISANKVGGVPGDGAWIWISLNKNHTGDYTMADCIHTGSAGLNAASHSAGNVTRTDDGTNLWISGVGAIGGLVPLTIKVPDRYGHYVEATDSIILVPPNPILPGFGGTAQFQVAR
jgi:hypothetical protein